MSGVSSLMTKVPVSGCEAGWRVPHVRLAIWPEVGEVSNEVKNMASMTLRMVLFSRKVFRTVVECYAEIAKSAVRNRSAVCSCDESYPGGVVNSHGLKVGSIVGRNPCGGIVPDWIKCVDCDFGDDAIHIISDPESINQ